MAQTLEPRTRAWLKWEWRAALITVVGGMLIVAAVFAYFTFRPQRLSPGALTARQVQTAALAQIVCVQALAGAKEFGIVPNYAQLANPYPNETKVRGRYECASGTNVAKYTIAVDLVCKQIGQRRCVVLHSVTQQAGTVLYRRQG